MCHFLQHLCDLQLRHRVESVVAFSDNYVESCQNVRMTCKLHLDIIHLGNKSTVFADGVQYIIYHFIVAIRTRRGDILRSSSQTCPLQ